MERGCHLRPVWTGGTRGTMEVVIRRGSVGERDVTCRKGGFER